MQAASITIKHFLMARRIHENENTLDTARIRNIVKMTTGHIPRNQLVTGMLRGMREGLFTNEIH